MTKYKEYFDLMLEQYKDLFDKFQIIHDNFVSDPATHKDEFNNFGQDVLRIVRKYDNLLCGKSESGKYSKFSSNLSEKFWDEVRIRFPKIDSVGVL